MSSALVATRLLLAAVFALAGVAKAVDRRGTEDAARGLGAPGMTARPAALLLPPLELALAALLLPATTAEAALLVAALLLAAFTTAGAVAVVRGKRVSCRCFGALSSEPLGRATLARNGLLVTLTAAAAFAPGAPGPGAGTWFGSLSSAGLAAVSLGAVLAVVTATSAALVAALLRRNGRLLLELDALGAGAPLSPADIELPVGSPAPPFAVGDRGGDALSLEGLLGEGCPLALVFTDAACGPCLEAIPDLARSQRELEGRLTIGVVSRGSTSAVEAAWREHDLRRVAVVDDVDLWLAYGVPASPGAIVVSADGRIASGPALGVGAIHDLLETAA